MLITVSWLSAKRYQGGTKTSLEDMPLLPWKLLEGETVIRERFARFRRQRDAKVIVDAASFYLPYLDGAIQVEPELRIVALKRPKEEVVESLAPPEVPMKELPLLPK